MALEVYSLENSIQKFFDTSTTSTRAECDLKAASLVGEPVKAVPMQGAWSYTVTAGSKEADIVQFRAQPSALDMANMNIAMLVHPQFVPRCTYHGEIVGQSPLSIYVMEKRNGLCYVIARDMSLEGMEAFEIRQLQTVRDLARFFAEAWKGEQQVPSAVASNLHHEIERDLMRLAENLPERFTRTLNEVLEGLPRIMTLPFVLTHGDLNEMNMLVDDNGHITGIVDWAESRILPFGFALWGLENILGYMNSKGWHYHDNAQKLRDEFWRIFEADTGCVQDDVKANIRLARMAGLFLRYGFEHSASVTGKVNDTDFALRYADAFCTGGL